MPESSPRFRPATREDLPAIVHLLADDPLGAERERDVDPLPRAYLEAFDAIEANPNDELVVATLDGAVVGVLQITFLRHVTHRGAGRALIEGVRVARDLRSRGIGRAMVAFAIARARGRGCRLVELTTNRSRADAQRFYESLGFIASHVGMKLELMGET